MAEEAKRVEEEIPIPSSTLLSRLIYGQQESVCRIQSEPDLYPLLSRFGNYGAKCDRWISRRPQFC